jgi:hypothetical protein
MLICVDNYELNKKTSVMVGYSHTSLIKKLGIKEEMKIRLMDEPEDYMEILRHDITKQLVNEISKADLLHIFVTSKKELEKRFSNIIANAKNCLIVWISWHKKSSGIETDVTEDVIREIVLPTGWVDVKVCAFSDEWSGLKIVKRKS